MQTKTATVEQYLLEKINSGVYAPNSRIPSQHQLMQRCACSRITVQRALERLNRMGYLQASKGSGTFVRPRPYENKVKKVVIVSEYMENSPRYPFSEMLFSLDTQGLPTHWVDNRFVQRNADQFFTPDQAVIWLLPSETQIMPMNYLKKRGIRQLLINRTYEDFDYICTDAWISLCEGVQWLVEKAGRNIAFISHAPSTLRPYLYERIMAFYEVCFEHGVRLTPRNIFKRDFSNLVEACNELGQQFFVNGNAPKGFFIMEYDLVAPTVLCASHHGLTLGKDYFLLTFDNVREISGHRGLAMMRQSMDDFGRGVEQWLRLLDGGNTEPFKLRLKTSLHIS